MATLNNLTITTPGPDGDGIGANDGQQWIISDCTVDFAAQPLNAIDEAIGITRGSSATIAKTNARNAGKLILCGSGDAEYIPAETGKEVIFSQCVLENFGRRAPEVQDGMIVRLHNCTIKNWGVKEYFDVRAFGAWAHHGGSIACYNCRFEQDSFWQTGVWNFFRDWFAHIGQAVNDEGLRGLFRLQTYLPGVCRGLTAGPGGTVKACNCTKNKWWIRIENNA